MAPRPPVEFESLDESAAVAPEPASSSTPILPILAVAAVIVALLVLVGRARVDEEPPDSDTSAAEVRPSTSLAPVESVDNVGEREAVAEVVVDEWWHRVLGADGPAGPDPTVLFTATPSGRSSAPPRMHVLREDGTTSRPLDGPMWLEEPTIEWPGEVLSPFVQTASSVVYSSEGTVWSQDLAFERPHKPIAEGLRVLAGVTDDDVWVIGSGTRRVQRVDVARGRVIDFGEPPGFPLAAFGDGLVVRLLQDGRTLYGVWWTHDFVEILPVDPGLDFLGVGGDRAIFGDGTQLAVYDRRSVSVSTVELERQIDFRRAAVSPDGRLVALASRPDIVSFSDIDVVEVKTGAIVDRFGPVIDLQLQFVDSTTVQFVAPGGDSPWWVMHRDTATRTDQTVAMADTPMLWFSELGGP